MSIKLATSQVQKREISPRLDHALDAANDSQIAGKIVGLKWRGLKGSELNALNWQQQRFSLITLIAVASFHLLLIVGFVLLNKPEPATPLAPEPSAMMVSLVADPAPDLTPEVVEIIPEPKPAIKKPKPVKQVTQPTLIPEVVPEQPVQAAEPEIAMPEPVMATAPAQVAKQETPIVKESPVVQEVVEPPKFGAAYLHNPAPSYPAVSRRVGEEGRVMLRVLVSKDGEAEQVEIETGSGFSRLDRAALEAVKNWRFIPAKRNNQPISAYVIVPIQFTLNS